MLTGFSDISVSEDTRVARLPSGSRSLADEPMTIKCRYVAAITGADLPDAPNFLASSCVLRIRSSQQPCVYCKDVDFLRREFDLPPVRAPKGVTLCKCGRPSLSWKTRYEYDLPEPICADCSADIRRDQLAAKNAKKRKYQADLAERTRLAKIEKAKQILAEAGE